MQQSVSKPRRGQRGQPIRGTGADAGFGQAQPGTGGGEKTADAAGDVGFGGDQQARAAGREGSADIA